NGPTNVILDDRNAAAGRQYVLTSSSLQFSTSLPAIQFSSVNGVVLNGATSARYYLDSTAAGTSYTVNTGGGTNNLSVGPLTNSLAAIGGPLTLNGTAGASSLIVIDQSDASDTTYAISASGIQGNGSAPITYAGMHGVTINGGSGNDIYDVE